MWGQHIQVGVTVLHHLAAARAFEVDDLDHLRRHLVDRQRPAGLQHHRVAVIQKRPHQVMDLVLQQRLAAGDFHEAHVVRGDGFQDSLDGHRFAVVKGVLRIAPRATQVAPGQPDEQARQAGPAGLALNAFENFGDLQHTSILPQLPPRFTFKTGPRPEEAG